MSGTSPLPPQAETRRAVPALPELHLFAGAAMMGAPGIRGLRICSLHSTRLVGTIILPVGGPALRF